MRAHFPDYPYTITQDIWDDYYSVQQSGIMNMMGHHYIGYFMQGDAYKQAYKHFEEEGNTEPLVIEE